ncbi:hypothetical protein Csa_019801, partial [Cucumis sativus]
MRGKRVKIVPSRRPYVRLADRGKISQTIFYDSSTSISVEKFGVSLVASVSTSGSDSQDGISLV